MEQYFTDVFHIDEITALFTVAVAETAFKELHFMITSVLEVLMESNARHTAFMLFVRTVDVEVLKPYDWRTKKTEFAAKDLIKEILGVAVDVERPLILNFFNKFRVSAVGGG